MKMIGHHHKFVKQIIPAVSIMEQHLHKQASYGLFVESSLRWKVEAVMK